MRFTLSPPPSMSLWVVAIHFVLLVLVLAAGLGLLGKRDLRPKPKQAALWLFVIATMTAACSLGLFVEAFRTHLVGYMTHVWVVAGTAAVLSLARRTIFSRRPSVVYFLGAVAAVGIVLGSVLPSLPSARTAARRTQCRTDLKNLGIALHKWHEEFGRFPDTAIIEDDNPPKSWRIDLLPYLGQDALWKRYNSTEQWDSSANLPVAQDDPIIYICPSNPYRFDRQERYITAYGLITGEGTVFPDGKGIALDEIADGASNTLLVGEACGLNIVWTKPQDIDADTDLLGINLPGHERGHSPALLSSHHKGGAHALFADGRVRFLPDNIDLPLLRSLITADAGDGLDDRP